MLQNLSGLAGRGPCLDFRLHRTFQVSDIMEKPPHEHTENQAGRWIEIGFGVLLAACAIAILIVVPDENLAGLAGGVALLLLGLEAVHAGWKGRRSLLFRIGPLP